MMSIKRPKTTKAKPKRSAQPMRRSKQQEAADNQNALVSSLAHHLRNPLGAVIFSLTLLERELASDPAKKRHLDVLKRASKEMTTLLDDFSECAQIEANELVVARAPVDPRALVQEAVEQAKRALADRPIEVHAALDEDLDVGRIELLGDRPRLLQAFARVVEDAARHMPEGGTITLGAEPMKGGVRLFVSDSGPKLPLADQRHLFLREAPKERKGCRGTGIGMFIAKGIVLALGGKATLVERDDASNTIAFTLPRAGKTRAKDS